MGYLIYIYSILGITYYYSYYRLSNLDVPKHKILLCGPILLIHGLVLGIFLLYLKIVEILDKGVQFIYSKYSTPKDNFRFSIVFSISTVLIFWLVRYSIVNLKEVM